MFLVNMVGLFLFSEKKGKRDVGGKRFREVVFFIMVLWEGVAGNSGVRSSCGVEDSFRRC